MKTTVVGNYPKISSSRDDINLRKGINDEEKGKIDSGQLEDIYKKTITRTIRDQIEAGVDIITDGQIRWQDLTWPFSTSITSVHPGGLRRFYDNNFYYRRPQVTGLMSGEKDIVTDDYIFASSNSERPVKAVLCGPVTFCDLSDNYYYKSFSKLAGAAAEIIAEAVASLAAAGCRHIQLDEPSLPKYPAKIDLARELYSNIFGGVDADCGLFVYFNSVAAIADELLSLPVNFIGLDFVSHPNDINCLKKFNPDCHLVAGLFDGRNIMVENEKSIRTKIEILTEKIAIENIVLSPSCGLEFLPQKYAVAKLKRMCEVAVKL